MWQFNVCAPFLYTYKEVQLVRKLMAGELWILLGIYAIIQVLYLFIRPIRRPVGFVGVPTPNGPPQSTMMFPQQGTVIAVPNAPMIGNQTVQEYRFCGRPFMNRHHFQQFYAILFGHHAVATAACIMYHPSLQAIILCGLYLLGVLLLGFFQMCGCKTLSKIIWVLMLVINTILLIMACIGIGATGYDYNNYTCYMKT